MPQKTKNPYLLPLIIVTSLFFFWGFIHNMNPVLIPHLKGAFQLTDLQSSLLDFSIYIAYFLMALPAGYFMRKYGYKKGILLGLTFFAIGAFLFIPAANTVQYPFFLGALFVIACGLAFLETAANPYVTVLGPKETATRRLNFAQSFNGLAAFLAPLIGGKFILSNQDLTSKQMNLLPDDQLHQYVMQEAASVKAPYAILGGVIVLVLIFFIFSKLPEVNEEKGDEKGGSIRGAWSHRHMRWSFFAQLFYIGSQICVLSFFIRFVTSSAGISNKEAAVFAGFAGLAFMIGRFAGTFFMKFVKPPVLLKIYAVLCMILTLVAIFSAGALSIYALIGVAFFMSIMFPTIFALGITDLGKDRKIASSLLVMSVVGGAILPLALGYISDLTGHIQYGYFVPFFCFLVVFVFANIGWQPAKEL